MEWVEHRIPLGNTSALVVYCATCLRVLADLPTNNAASQLQARMVAQNHYDAYSRPHTLVITDVKDRRMEYFNGQGFDDITPHD